MPRFSNELFKGPRFLKAAIIWGLRTFYGRGKESLTPIVQPSFLVLFEVIVIIMVIDLGVIMLVPFVSCAPRNFHLFRPS
jgi:hypothetical protein